MASSTSDCRYVIDTNVLVSSILLSRSPSLTARELASSEGALLFSPGTYSELVGVLSRPKFDRYLPLNERIAFARAIYREAVWVDVDEPIAACRDSRDDKFLEVAVNGGAGFLVTGDEDLLVLDPFRGIRIVTPQAFVGAVAPQT